MAISEFEIARCQKVVGEYVDKKRPPPHIRPQLDIGFRVTDQSIELFEIRPLWQGKQGEKIEHAIAKTTYVKSRGVWKVFWQRQDLQWHAYEPCPEVRRLEDFLEVLEQDEYCCFYG